jgi:hypothetical protein
MWNRWILKHILMCHVLFARSCSHNSWAGCGKNGAQWSAPRYAIRLPNMEVLYEIPNNELYLLIWAVSSDRYAINSQGIGTANRWRNLKESFPAFVRVSLQKRGVARAVQIDVKPLHYQHKWGSLSGAFRRFPLPGNRKCTYIFGTNVRRSGAGVLNKSWEHRG